MFELIYTRCKQGIDILKKGQQILVDGYKVYSCTPAIMQEGAADLPLLENAAKSKQSYIDPGFMDDAYLYYTPDTGKSFLVNFYPVPFNTNAEGDYSRRPGNFVNHIFLGDFSGFYPYELFNDKEIWTAKEKGEAYYYENIPSPEGLPEHDINDPCGQYDFEDDIGAFIKDGRQEAFKKAVAFLVAQCSEEPEKRKYLVIKDENAKNIELWIAAIECAFSPRIAASISFATRMDKFANVNRYTVKNNLFQTQINLQDPNQKQRFRAMIIGVDERDKTNAGAARPLANSPFVLLDGKLKQAAFEAEISNPYFEFITRFDDAHRIFCRQFLQTANITNPSTEIYELYTIYSSLNKSSLPDTKTLSVLLGKLSKYQLSKSNKLKELYGNVRNAVSKILQDDLSCALKIISWLQETSKIIGDSADGEQLSNTVCKKFAESLFKEGDSAGKKTNWTIIKGTEFAEKAARFFSNIKIITEHINSLQNSPSDIAAFIYIYYDASLLLGNVNENDFYRIVKYGVNICCSKKDTNSLDEIAKTLSKAKNIHAQEFLLSLAKSEHNTLDDFFMNYIIDSDKSIIENDNTLQDFYKKLEAQRLEKYIVNVFKKKCAYITKPDNVEAILKTIKKLNVKEDTFTEILGLIKKDILVEYFIKAKLTEDEQNFYLNLLSDAPEGCFPLYVEELLDKAEKYKDKWNALINFAAGKKNSTISSCIAAALNNSNQKEKALLGLGKIIKEENARKYYERIFDKAKGGNEDDGNEIRAKKKPEQEQSEEKPQKGGTFLSSIFGGKNK